MSPKKLRPGAGQEAFPIDGLSPSVPPDIVDLSTGVSTPLIEGWSVMHRAIKEVSRAHSNRDGFAKLSVNSRPVQEFAERINESPDEAKMLVVATGNVRRKEGQSLTHYDKAQIWLSDYHKKQVERAKTDLRMRAIGDIALVTESLPMSVADVEHRYFDAKTPEGHKNNQKQRRGIARYVKKHSL